MKIILVVFVFMFIIIGNISSIEKTHITGTKIYCNIIDGFSEIKYTSNYTSGKYKSYLYFYGVNKPTKNNYNDILKVYDSNYKKIIEKDLEYYVVENNGQKIAIFLLFKDDYLAVAILANIINIDKNEIENLFNSIEIRIDSENFNTNELYLGISKLSEYLLDSIINDYYYFKKKDVNKDDINGIWIKSIGLSRFIMNNIEININSIIKRDLIYKNFALVYNEIDTKIKDKYIFYIYKCDIEQNFMYEYYIFVVLPINVYDNAIIINAIIERNDYEKILQDLSKYLDNI